MDNNYYKIEIIRLNEIIKQLSCKKDKKNKMKSLQKSGDKNH